MPHEQQQVFHPSVNSSILMDWALAGVGLWIIIVHLFFRDVLLEQIGHTLTRANKTTQHYPRCFCLAFAANLVGVVLSCPPSLHIQRLCFFESSLFFVRIGVASCWSLMSFAVSLWALLPLLFFPVAGTFIATQTLKIPRPTVGKKTIQLTNPSTQLLCVHFWDEIIPSVYVTLSLVYFASANFLSVLASVLLMFCYYSPGAFFLSSFTINTLSLVFYYSIFSLEGPRDKKQSNWRGSSFSYLPEHCSFILFVLWDRRN